MRKLTTLSLAALTAVLMTGVPAMTAQAGTYPFSGNQASCTTGNSNLGNMNLGNMNFGNMNFGNMNAGNKNCGSANFGNAGCKTADCEAVSCGDVSCDDAGCGEVSQASGLLSDCEAAAPSRRVVTETRPQTMRTQSGNQDCENGGINFGQVFTNAGTGYGMAGANFCQ